MDPRLRSERADSNASEKRQGAATKLKGPDIAGGIFVIPNVLANDKDFERIPELINFVGKVEIKYNGRGYRVGIGC